jgi:hypothetical protein
MGKRSCWESLAGHNKQRWKAQAEETGCQEFTTGGLKNFYIASLTTVLSQQKHYKTYFTIIYVCSGLAGQETFQCYSIIHYFLVDCSSMH